MTAGLVAAVVACAALAGGTAGAAGDRAARSTAVGIGLREWSVTVYRPRIHAGRVRLNMTNFGEDAHNLRVDGPAGYRSATSADVPAGGGRDTLTVNLRRRGVYRLVCVKLGHPELGMKARLRVVRRSRGRAPAVSAARLAERLGAMPGR